MRPVKVEWLVSWLRPYVADVNLLPPMPRPGDGYRVPYYGFDAQRDPFPAAKIRMVTRNLCRLYANLDRYRELIDL